MSNLQKHHWSDWAGFTAFSFIWVGVVMKTPSLGLMMAPLVLHPFLSSIGFALRRQPVKVIGGVTPRLTSYLSTFGVVLFFLLAEYWRPQWVAFSGNLALTRMGNIVWFAGGLLDAWVVWSLRHSMSIVPQARMLITTGPYRFARHPLYVAYMIELAGLWLRYTNLPVALAFLAWLVLTLRRIRYEEGVLLEAFPEYGAYHARVGMLSPRLGSRLPRQAPASAPTSRSEVEIAEVVAR